MAVFTRHGGVAVKEGRLDNQQVGIANMLRQSLRGFGIAHDDQLLASLSRSQDVFRIDRSTVREHHRFSFGQLPAHRAVRHSESREAVRSEMAPGQAFEGESETVGVTMANRK